MQISRKNMTRVLVAVLILVALIAAVAWRGAAARRSMAGSPTEMTAVVSRGNLEVIVPGSGTVQPEVREDVRVPFSGSIMRYEIEEGRKVSAGDVLAKLDVQDMGLQMERKCLDIQIQERELQRLREEETEAVFVATESGAIDWNARDGDRVQPGSIIATITGREYLTVVDYERMQAVISQGGRNTVYVLTGDGGSRPVEVQTGANDESRMQIVSSLNEGQQILIQGTTARSMPMPAPGGGMFGRMRERQGTNQ